MTSLDSLSSRLECSASFDLIFSQIFYRGARIEKIVEIITHNPSLLWGGLTLPPWSGRTKKHSWYKTSSPGHKQMATDDQIVDFVLTTYKSYVHPSIFMRLLLHR